MTYAEHRLDIYGTAIFCATTKREWRELAKVVTFLPKTPPAETYGQVSTASWQPKKGLSLHTVVVWIHSKKHTDPGELIDTCAHEASHAAGRILEAAGHDVPATDEPHAYLVGWLTRWVWEHSTKP